MVNLTLSLPQELKGELQKHQEVNWSAVIRRSLQEHLKKIKLAEAIASRSHLTRKDAEELDKLVKKAIAKNHYSL